MQDVQILISETNKHDDLTSISLQIKNYKVEGKAEFDLVYV